MVGARPATKSALAEFVESVDRFHAMATEASVDTLIVELVTHIGYDAALRAEGPEGLERLDNVAEFIRGAAELVIEDGGEIGLRPLDHFLQQATLVAGLDQLGPDADAVTMMTLHTAKGLEFPVVFVAGMEDGLFPLSRAVDDPDTLEEERRLFYVGITRAERKLYLSWARSRRRNGETMPSMLSRFVNAAAQQLLEPQPTIRLRASGRAAMTPAVRTTSSWDDAAPNTWRRTPSRERAVEFEDQSQVPIVLARGARVKHKTFGSGTVAEASGSGRDAKVTIDFDDESVGRKRLVVAFAGLEQDDD
jgi:DNA helicase-2/ATP-dependent DNA helicase PcrA